MNEVRLKVQGIIQVEENRQRITKNAAIAMAQNNFANSLLKYQETKKKLEDKQQRSGGRSNKKKRPSEFQRNDYQCNPSKRFKVE